MKKQGRSYYSDSGKGYNYKFTAFVEKVVNGWEYQLHYTSIDSTFGFREEKETEVITGIEKTKKEAMKAYMHEVDRRSLGEDYKEKLEELYESL